MKMQRRGADVILQYSSSWRIGCVLRIVYWDHDDGEVFVCWSNVGYHCCKLFQMDMFGEYHTQKIGGRKDELSNVLYVRENTVASAIM